MKHLVLILIAILSLSTGQAQNIEKLIPASAFATAKINGISLNNKAAISTISELPVMKEFFREFNNVDNFDDLGFDLSKNIFSFATKTDSIIIGYIAIPLKDRIAFEKNIIGEYSPEEISNRQLNEGEMVSVWDDQLLLMAVGEINRGFAKKDSLFKQKYGFHYDEDDYYDSGSYDYEENSRIEVATYEDEVADAADAADAAVEAVDGAIDAVKDPAEYQEIQEVSENDPMNTYWEDGVEYYINGEPVADYEVEVMDNDYIVTTNNNASDIYQKRDSLNETWLLAGINSLKSSNNQKNMNKYLSKMIGSNSDISLYVDYGDAMGTYIDMLYGYSSYSYYSDGQEAINALMSIYGGVKLTSEMNFNEDNLHIDADYIMGEKVVDLYDGLMDQKFNKKFLKHMDFDNMLAYYSMSLNAESIIKMYPKLIAQIVDKFSYTKGYGQPVADLLSIILDEEAIGEIFTGNAVLLCDGLTQQKTTFVSYDYDENFNRVEVKNESEELLPSILMMLETKKPKLIRDFINIGVREGVILSTPYGFEIPPNSELPVGIHIIFKDEIIYICNDSNKMKNIVAGQSTGSSNKKHKKLLKKNNSIIFVDAKQSLEAIPYTPYSETDKKSWDLLKNSVRDISIAQYQKNKYVMSSSMDFNLGEGSGNAWQYIWDAFNEFYLIETGN